MESFDAILKGAHDTARGVVSEVQAEPAVVPSQEAPKGETASTTETTAQAQPAAQVDDDEGETPSPDVYGKVPLKALESERAKRQDWKAKAIQAEERQRAAEERIAAMEKERQTAQTPPAAQPQQTAPVRTPALPNPVEDPEGYQRALDARFEKQRLDLSEAATRRAHGDDAVNAAFETFKAHATPAEYKAVMADRDPWGALVEKSKSMALRAEIGTDPNAYEAKLREKIRAEVEQERRDAAPVIDQNAKEAAPHRPPPSLAAARSSGSSKAPAAAWTGPVPLAGLVGANAASVRR